MSMTYMPGWASDGALNVLRFNGEMSPLEKVLTDPDLKQEVQSQVKARGIENPTDFDVLFILMEGMNQRLKSIEESQKK